MRLFRTNILHASVFKAILRAVCNIEVISFDNPIDYGLSLTNLISGAA